jgi:hypothetical protein
MNLFDLVYLLVGAIGGYVAWRIFDRISYNKFKRCENNK